jgi:small subunit ribosomal protein S24e
MEVRIVEERTNPLLKRHELRFEVAHATAATPTRDSVRAELAKAVNAPKDRVIIERMRPRFGTAVTRGQANVYESTEAAKSISREHILVRNGLKEKVAKGAAGEAPAGPSAPEAPSAPAAEPKVAEATPPAAKEPGPKSEPKAEAKPEGKAEGKPEAKPEGKAEGKSEAAEPAKRPKAHAKKE